MSYFPMVSGSSTNLDENKRISDAELTIIFRKAQQATQVPNLTNLFPIKNDNYWLKIGKIGNYCQLKTACCLPYRNSPNSRYLPFTMYNL